MHRWSNPPRGSRRGRLHYDRKRDMHHDIEAIQETIHKESAFVERLLGEVGRVIVGQRAMVERLVIGAAGSMDTC